MNTTKSMPALKASSQATQAPDIQQQPHAPSSPDTTSVFDFFGLSRELRDMIYRQPALLEEQRVAMESSWADYEDDRLEENSEFWTVTATVPRTSLLLVSHKFNQEYSDGWFELRALSMRQIRMYGSIGFLPPAIAANTTSLDLELLSNGSLDDNFSSAMDWVTQWVKHMPRLASIAVTFYTKLPAFAVSAWVNFMAEEDIATLVALKHVKQLDVIAMGKASRTSSDYFNPYDPGAKKIAAARWIPPGGSKDKNKALDQFFRFACSEIDNRSDPGAESDGEDSDSDDEGSDDDGSGVDSERDEDDSSSDGEGSV